MSKHQDGVSVSLSTKLLLSIVLLLLIAVLFLGGLSVFLFQKDKKAYTFQLQSSETLLASKAFLHTSSKGLDTLRIALATFNPLKTLGTREQNDLNSIIQNQSELLGLAVHLLDTHKLRSFEVTRAFNRSLIEPSGMTPSDFQLPQNWYDVGAADLLENGYAFANLSQAGYPPLLGIVFADLSLLQNPNGMPVAIGYVSLDDFGSNLRGSSVTISDIEGWVLYSTDPSLLFGQSNISTDPLFKLAASSRTAEGAAEFPGDREEGFLGSFLRSGNNLVVLSRTPQSLAMRATYELTEEILLVAGMILGGAIIFALMFSNTLVRNLRRLYLATQQVASGDFKLNLDIDSGDEIGALSTSFNAMSGKIQDLIELSKAQVRMEGELAIASTVQQTLIPPTQFRNENILIHSHYEPASECGGDWWGFFGVGNKIAIMIGDATGHGLPSALITAAARSCVSMLHKLAQEHPDFSFSPGSMLSYANRVIYDAAAGKIMMTFFAGVIDFSEQKMTYASAGHNPPWLLTREGSSFNLKSLTSKGVRLGENRDTGDYEEQTISVAPGDLLFLYTDGILEGKNMRGEDYGKKRMRQLAIESAAGGPSALIAKLVEDFKKHNGTKPLDDDVTLAAATLWPGSGGQP